MQVAEGIGGYIDAKMEISRRHPAGSKVWASEVMHRAPVIQDYLETTLVEWTEGRMAIIRRWIDEGKMNPVDPRHLLYMLWATTQHYADYFKDQPILERVWSTTRIKILLKKAISRDMIRCDATHNPGNKRSKGSGSTKPPPHDQIGGE